MKTKETMEAEAKTEAKTEAKAEAKTEAKAAKEAAAKAAKEAAAGEARLSQMPDKKPLGIFSARKKDTKSYDRNGQPDSRIAQWRWLANNEKAIKEKEEEEAVHPKTTALDWLERREEEVKKEGKN
tara:strand:- start:656 stop:1033 length:378 start_codon:yes stop_codon:yes gene_type:complete